MVKKDEPVVGTEYTRWIQRGLLLGDDAETPVSGTSPLSVRNFAGQNDNFFTEIAKGNIPGHEAVFLIGTSEEITTTEQTLWDGATDIIDFDITPASVSIVSDSANDTLGGTGGNSILIRGLDENRLDQVEIIPLTGLTPSLTTLTFSRVNFAILLSAGTLKKNEGILSMTISGKSVGRILPGNIRTRQMLWSAGSDETILYYITGANGGKDDEIKVSFYAELPFNGSISTPLSTFYIYQDSLVYANKFNGVFPSGSDFELRATKTGSAGVARLGMTAEIVIVKNEYL